MVPDNIFTRFCRAYVAALNEFDRYDPVDARLLRREHMVDDFGEGEVFLYKEGYKKNIFGKETDKPILNYICLPTWFFEKLGVANTFETKNSMLDMMRFIKTGSGYTPFEYPTVRIKQLGEFIVNISKYYLVDVDSLKNFTVINHDQYSITILIEKDDAKVKYEFIESAINLPGKNGFNFSDDNPLSFINDKSTENKNVEFINITVMDNDDSVVDEFKYVYGQHLEDETVEKTNLFNYIIDLSKIVVFDTFSDIINKYVFKRTKFYMETGWNVTVKEFLDDGSNKVWRR